MSLFPAPPLAETTRHQLEETTVTGPLGGPSCGYRGAVIDCMKGGHVCRLILDGHPLTGMSFGVAGTITPLVDLWLNEGRLPAWPVGSAAKSIDKVITPSPSDPPVPS
jgi:hypothetical protein